MKRFLIRHLFMLMALVGTGLLATSCEEMWGIDDDRWAEDVLNGDWVVTRVDYATVDCPYYEGDVFSFIYDQLVVSGEGGLYERGYWEVSGRTLYVDFDGDGLEDIAAYISSMSSRSIVLDVKDYSFRTDYRLYLEPLRYWTSKPKLLPKQQQSMRRTHASEK